ncbi:MAG: 50S ribosomal protein L35 [Deltaproteobacteria bacterium]|nr:50S ribosomal protein L35 [Deltaproteobacteria bacterium]
MPKLKLKTNKGAAKRMRITAKGKVLRRKAGMRHLLSGKSASRKRRLGKALVAEKANAPSVKKLLPYA